MGHVFCSLVKELSVNCAFFSIVHLFLSGLGHVLLTLLLMDSLKEGVKNSQLGRIVNVSSTLHNNEENPRMMKGQSVEIKANCNCL